MPSVFRRFINVPTNSGSFLMTSGQGGRTATKQGARRVFGYHQLCRPTKFAKTVQRIDTYSF